MLGETAKSSYQGSAHTISAIDFTSGKIQAIITPSSGGPSFTLPIDTSGNIIIPPSMQSAFQNRSFAFLEVGEVMS